MFEASDATARRRLALLAITLATIPCYCIGWIAVALAPQASSLTPVATTITSTFTLTNTPTTNAQRHSADRYRDRLADAHLYSYANQYIHQHDHVDAIRAGNVYTFGDPDPLANTFDYPIPYAFAHTHTDNYINTDHHIDRKSHRLPNSYSHSITWPISFLF